MRRSKQGAGGFPASIISTLLRDTRAVAQQCRWVCHRPRVTWWHPGPSARLGGGGTVAPREGQAELLPARAPPRGLGCRCWAHASSSGEGAFCGVTSRGSGRREAGSRSGFAFGFPLAVHSAGCRSPCGEPEPGPGWASLLGGRRREEAKLSTESQPWRLLNRLLPAHRALNSQAVLLRGWEGSGAAARP